MVDNVKNAKEFKCLMEKRKNANRFHTGFNVVIRTTKNGYPYGERDKRQMCEMEKLALGSDTAYMECERPMKAPIDMTARDDEVRIKKGEWCREVYVVMSEEEMESLNRFFVPLLTGKRMEAYDNISFGPRDATTCAYPGGCK